MLTSGKDTRHALFLADASKLLAGSLDYETTLRVVARTPIPEVADWCAVDILDDDAVLQRVAVAHIDPAREAWAWELARRYAPGPTALEGVPKVLRTGRVELVDAAAETVASEHVLLLRALGLPSGISAPLVARERTIGALSIAARRSLHQADVELVAELASRCAQAIDNAWLYRLAREGVQLRDTFVATVSHDLKNPLATIAGQAQLLRRQRAREAPLPVRVVEGLNRIESTVSRMTRMIDELLDVTRLELGGRLELDRRPMDLVETAHRIVAEHQQRTNRHVIQVAGEPELVGKWDRARLERMLDNLVGNAVKYSPKGGAITVVCVREDDDAESWAIVSVRDQGVGIPAADLTRIFERFHRARNVGEISGTGIGLATIRDVVEQHGGSIIVDSHERQGSTFTIRLPISSSCSRPAG